MQRLDACIHFVAHAVDMFCLDTILLWRLGHGDFRSALELRKDTGLLGLVGMEFQTERTQSY